MIGNDSDRLAVIEIAVMWLIEAIECEAWQAAQGVCQNLRTMRVNRAEMIHARNAVLFKRPALRAAYDTIRDRYHCEPAPTA